VSGGGPLPSDGAVAGGPGAGGPPGRGGGGGGTPGGGDEGSPEGSERPQDGNLIGRHTGTVDWHVRQACQQTCRAWNGVQCSP